MATYCVPDVLAPDLIITNGNIITMDAAFSKAEALAVKDGKIVAVGDRNKIEALRGDATQTLDLQGKTVLPGINDTHLCVILGISTMPPAFWDMSPANVSCIEDMRNILREAVSKAEPGQWIQGGAWNQGAIKELVEDPDRRLRKEDFDDIAPDNPIYLSEFSWHTGVANSAALKAAGITRDTPDPQDGEIVKDADGEPTGLLLEKANALVVKVMPPLTYQEKRAIFESNIDMLTKYGITSVTSANERPFDINFYSNLYRDYAKEGKPFPIRISALMLWAESVTGGDLPFIEEALKHVGTTTCFGNDFLRIAGIKVFADGIPPTKTAWTSRPYEDGTHGSLIIGGKDDDEKVANLNKIVDICHSEGYQVAFHTCGDLAVKAAVEAIARNMAAEPKDLRHYVIHGDWVLPESMELMAKYDIQLATQSELLYDLADDTLQRMGMAVAAEQWPLKEMLDKGVRVSNSSDWPAGGTDWRKGVQASIVRKSRNGVVCGPHQALNIEEALRTYTTAGAWLDHMEDRKGAIEPGMLADFCIIGEDITAVNPEKIEEIPVNMTIVGGKVVYTDNSLEIK